MATYRDCHISSVSLDVLICVCKGDVLQEQVGFSDDFCWDKWFPADVIRKLPKQE